MGIQWKEGNPGGGLGSLQAGASWVFTGDTPATLVVHSVTPPSSLTWLLLLLALPSAQTSAPSRVLLSSALLLVHFSIV